MKRLAVIDGKSVFYRGYYAMPGLATADGTPTGGVYGFVTLAIELIKKLEPDYVAVAWDKPKTNIRKRLEIYPEYKAGRKSAPADFYAQIPLLHELLDAFGWPLYEIDDYEADDIMATFAKEASEKGIETILLTSDLDALQAVSDHTKVYALKNGLSNLQEFTPESFEEKYGLKTTQFLDLKSLMGDSSDNLPGVPGVGQKTAIKLLQQYGDLDGVYSHLDEMKGALKNKLEAGRQSAFMTREVAKLWDDVPVKLDWSVADVNDCDFNRVAAILRRLEFHSLVGRLPKNMQATAQTVSPKISHEVPELKQLTSDIIFDSTLYIATDENKLLIGFESGEIYQAEIADIADESWRAIEQGIIVAEDLKKLYHQLDNLGIRVRFDQVWDINQASFLLDPLARDRSLAALSGDFEEDDLPARQVMQLRTIYHHQQDKLKQHPTLLKIAQELDFPVIWPLFSMERRGIRLDAKQLNQMSQELSDELKKVEQEIYSLVGYEFNIASPQQLSEVLFTKLQLPTVGIKKGRTGYSTDQKSLDKLRGQHPVIELIERSREFAKLKNTYVDTLPAQADAKGRIHTTFSQDVAATGRLSSNHPNLQNIPVRSELGRQIRQAFIPSEGKVFVSADYSQFELRLAAVLAGDEQLIKDFNGDVDIHAKTASDVYGVPLDEVTKDQRRDAKVINFGVLYGMSPHGLSAATGMTFTQAKQFIDQYFELRAPIRRYIDKTLEKARIDGYVETYYGRRRPTPDIQSSNFMVRQSAERAAANMPIQGTEADLMKRAMIQVEEKLSDKADQLLQIHDSILVECSPSDAKKVADEMKQIMENIAPELPIKLRVDVSTGKNWREA